MTMDDYMLLYKDKALKGIWPEFFTKGVLYREIMQSRALAKSKIVFIKFLFRYEQAFTTGKFTRIA